MFSNIFKLNSVILFKIAYSAFPTFSTETRVEHSIALNESNIIHSTLCCTKWEKRNREILTIAVFAVDAL